MIIKCFLSSANLITGHVDVRIFGFSGPQGQQASKKSDLISLKMRETSGCSMVVLFLFFFFLLMSIGRVS